MGSNAYEDGFYAFIEGYGQVESNPYPDTTEEHLLWLDGRNFAADSMKKQHTISNADKH